MIFDCIKDIFWDFKVICNFINVISYFFNFFVYSFCIIFSCGIRSFSGILSFNIYSEF